MTFHRLPRRKTGRSANLLIQGTRDEYKAVAHFLYNYLHIINWYPRHTSTIDFAAKPHTQTFYILHGYRGEWDYLACSCHASLRKQPTFGDATSSFPAKWRVRNERRNSIPMTRLYPDMGSASDWSCRVGNLIQAIRRTTQIWVVTRHQYGISALVSKTSFGGETSGSVAKCRLFSQATVTRAGF